MVRLTGPRRVDVHTKAGGQPTRFDYDDELPAVGGLSGAIPVAALFDKERAEHVAFHNLLARYGYRSLDEVRSEARAAGLEEGREEGLACASGLLLRLLPLKPRRVVCRWTRNAWPSSRGFGGGLEAVLEAIEQGRWP